MNQQNTRDLLLGIAIGDAFGAGVEFQDRDWIREQVDFTRFVNARHLIKVPKEQKLAFTQNYHAWDYTDDTEMTIGMMKALMSPESFSEDLLVSEWKAEYEKGKTEKGFGRNGHGSMSWYYSGEKTIAEIRSFQKHRKNPGNAPAMRAVPIGLINENLINEFSAINARATHPNQIAILSSQCIARATEFLLIKNGHPKQLFDYCRNNIELNQEYLSYFEEIETIGDYNDLDTTDFEKLCGQQPIQKPYFLDGIKGVPSDSKYTTGCVLYILQQSMDAMDALKKSIYLGGDVDSVASITTGIMAVQTGFQSLPNFMLDNIEGRDYLEKVADDFWETIFRL